MKGGGGACAALRLSTRCCLAVEWLAPPCVFPLVVAWLWNGLRRPASLRKDFIYVWSQMSRPSPTSPASHYCVTNVPTVSKTHENYPATTDTSIHVIQPQHPHKKTSDLNSILTPALF